MEQRFFYAIDVKDFELGFLDKLRKKKEDEGKKTDESPAEKQGTNQSSGKRIKRYTSEGKPVYE